MKQAHEYSTYDLLILVIQNLPKNKHFSFMTFLQANSSQALQPIKQKKTEFEHFRKINLY